MHTKRPLTIDDLKPPVPGEAQMIPFALWSEYQRRYGLVIVKQAWDTQRHCPVVYTADPQER